MIRFRAVLLCASMAAVAQAEAVIRQGFTGGKVGRKIVNAERGARA
jgi:hypothetical protein